MMIGENNERRNMKSKNSEKGITIISLVVTIVVLIILAGVTFNGVIGENGILNSSKRNKETHLNETYQEGYKMNMILQGYANEMAEEPQWPELP